MSKFLIILLLLAGSSLFAVEAFALEVEIQKESDRIIESKGWIDPEIHSFKEIIELVIDQKNQQSRVFVNIESTNPNDIKFPDEIEAFSSNPKIFSFTFTNQYACAPSQINQGCVVVEIMRDGLGDSLAEIKENAREIADKSIGSTVFVFSAENLSAIAHLGFFPTIPSLLCFGMSLSLKTKPSISYSIVPLRFSISL